MGSIDLETANMFSDEEDDDLPPVPQDMPPLSPTRRGDEPEGNGGETGPFDDIPQGGENEEGNEGTQRPKRMIRRNPMPKLDHVRLTSDRGLPTILKHFENIKFKGKGHEVSDLNTLMMTMEHWGNRLFPKMTFDEVIERVEKLGKKKPVQVCLQKIRMDMPLLDEDFVGREEEEDDVVRGEEPTEDDQQLPDLPNATTTPGNVSYGALDISEDQKNRMEENRRKAMEKRAARMQQQSSQNTTGITANELADISQSKSVPTGKIDSDDEDLENEMWNDLITSQQTSTQRPQNKNDNKKQKSTIDSDEEELEREAWNEISKSQVKKSIERCPEYDEETDDDDDYEEYFTKLKGIQSRSSSGNVTDTGVKDKTESSSQLDETDEQSLSILEEDVHLDNVTMVTVDTAEEEQSQSILGDDAGKLSSSVKGDDSKEGSSNQEADKIVEDANVHQDDSEKNDLQESQTENPDVDGDEATCLPEDDTQMVEGDDATCLPEEHSAEQHGEENIADLETQLLEEEDTAAMETQAIFPGIDTAEAETVAIATQEVKESSDIATAEAETMEYEEMNTAEAETQIVN